MNFALRSKSAKASRESTIGPLTVASLRTELDRFARIHLRAELEFMLNENKSSTRRWGSLGNADQLPSGRPRPNSPAKRVSLEGDLEVHAINTELDVTRQRSIGSEDEDSSRRHARTSALSGRSSLYSSFAKFSSGAYEVDDLASDLAEASRAPSEIEDPKIAQRRKTRPARENTEERPIFFETSEEMTEVINEPVRGSNSSYVALATGDDDDACSSIDSVGDRGSSRRPEELSTITYFARSELFDIITGALIVANAILLGLETDYCARHSVTSEAIFETVQLVFCLLFSIEISLRLYANGWRTLLPPSRQWAWNSFDACVVVLQIGEASARLIMMWEGHSILLRSVRIIRLIRIFRLVRLLHHAGELRMLVNSLTASVHSLAWTILLVLMMTYMFGVYLTQLATESKVNKQGNAEDLDLLLQFFGTLDRSVLSLYEAISEGIHWREMLEPLMRTCSSWVVLPFVGYMSFMLFALMNVVTGIFVDSATRAGEQSEKKILMDHMSEIFQQADTDKSGSVSMEEFQAQLKLPAMRKCLAALDMDSKDAQELFHLLDTDQCGEVEHRDFIRNCRKLQGGAKAIDVRAIMQELRRFIRKWEYHSAIIEDEVTFLVGKDQKQLQQQQFHHGNLTATPSS